MFFNNKSLTIYEINSSFFTFEKGKWLKQIGSEGVVICFGTKWTTLHNLIQQNQCTTEGGKKNECHSTVRPWILII